MSADPPRLNQAWKWSVCGLLLLATMLNYMDRMTLSQLMHRMQMEFAAAGTPITDEQYGQLEQGFGLAFAVGSITLGIVADAVNPFWLYPFVLLAWSVAGYATGMANDFETLLLSRTILGFFEAGQWPCALIVSQRILERHERTLGNSILQSGAALGAVITPLLVRAMLTPETGSWRWVFQAIGLMGLAWAPLWWMLGRPADVAKPRAHAEPARGTNVPAAPAFSASVLAFRIAALVGVVVTINMAWHVLRVWMPKFLLSQHDYSQKFTDYFTAAYYISADVGSILIGFLSLQLVTRRGWRVHSARLSVFAVCALLTCSSMIAAKAPTGPLLLVSLLIYGFGSLGLFPVYYSLTQEISTRRQGLVTGSLGFTTWVSSALIHPIIGRHIDETKSYAEPIFVAGLLPLVGLAALLLLWRDPVEASDKETP